MGSSHTLDQLDTCFDDTHAVANAGLLLPATLAERLGIEQAADALIDLGELAGAHRPGRKLLAGGDCIDDADVLRCGATSQVLGHRVMAPSTLGTFLRSFTFGHVRQLDRLAEQVLAWILEQRIEPWLDAGRHASPQPHPVPGNGSSAAKPTAAWAASLNTRASRRRWRDRRTVPALAGRVWRIAVPGRGMD